MSQKLDMQRPRNSNLQKRRNLLSRELLKHKKCLVALIEANFEVMTKLMEELKTSEDSDGDDGKAENETET